MTRYSPTDPWPTHPRPYLRDVYKKARLYGWSIETHTSHTGSATLYCPSESCVLAVFATGKGGESVAKRFLLQIERCQHGMAHDALARATRLLDGAERLLTALDSIRESQRLQFDAGALIDLPSYDEQEIEELWVEAERLAAEAQETLEEVPDADSETALGVVDDRLAEAGELLRGVPARVADLREQKSRLRKLRERCSAHRSRIGLI